jgi:hypothetical protein
VRRHVRADLSSPCPLAAKLTPIEVPAAARDTESRGPAHGWRRPERYESLSCPRRLASSLRIASIIASCTRG